MPFFEESREVDAPANKWPAVAIPWGRHIKQERARVAKAQQKIQRTVSGSVGSTDSILDAVARLESNVEEAEAQLEVQANLTGDYSASPTLERKLDELSHESEVEERLKKIRQELSS